MVTPVAMALPGRFLVGVLFGVLVLIVAACREDSGPVSVTAVCNPTPISQPSLPEIVGSIVYEGGELHGPVHSIFPVGEWVYMGLGDAFVIIDASVAAEPEITGWLSMGGFSHQSYRNFSVREGLAYFTWNGRDYTIDVSDPTSPQLVRCSSPVPWPEAEVAFGERYFINNSFLGGITIEERPLGGVPFEVAEFTATTLPELKWEQPPGQPVPLPVYKEGEPMYVRSYTFDDRYLYLLNVLRTPGDYCCGQLTILDMKNPQEPDLLSAIALPQESAPLSVKVVDEWLFISLYESRGNSPETWIYDISNRKRPQELGVVPVSVLPVVNGGYAYFPGDDDVDIWHLEAEELALIGKIQMTAEDRLSIGLGEGRIVFVEDTIYIGYRERLVILDNADRANPAFTTALLFPERPLLERLAVGNGRLVGGSKFQEMLQMELVGGDGLGQWRSLLPQPAPNAAVDLAVDVAVDGEYVAVLGLAYQPRDVFTTQVTLLDSSGAVAASLLMPEVEGRWVALDYPYAYVLDATTYDSTLLVVDFSDLTGPQVVARIGLAADFYKDMAIWGDNLYLATTANWGGVWQFDISERERPELVANRPFGRLHTITVGDGYLFGVNISNQIEVLRLGPDGEGVFVGRYNIERRNVADIAYGDGVLYLALSERGTAAVRLNLE